MDHWAREIASLGNEVALILLAHAKPFVTQDKNDESYAGAIYEAAWCLTIP